MESKGKSMTRGYIVSEYQLNVNPEDRQTRHLDRLLLKIRYTLRTLMEKGLSGPAI